MNLQAVLVKPVKHIDSWVILILSFSALRESGSQNKILQQINGDQIYTI